MHHSPNRRTSLAIVAVPVAAIAITACGGSGNSGQAAATAATPPAAAAKAKHKAKPITVKTRSTGLGTILVNSKAMTLYHLTAEKNGKFICTDTTCMQLWHPLRVAGKTPRGAKVGSLSTVKRPDGTKQVTYKGFPLYTFVQDMKPGDTKGQGFKDVGTWTVIRTKSSTTQQMPPPSNTGGGGGYGGY